MAPSRPGRSLRGAIVPTTVDPEVAKAQKKHEGTPFEITVEQIEPERLFSFRWHPYAIESADYSAEPTTLVAFALEEVAGGVMLTVTESGFDQIPLARRAQAFLANEQGWGMQVKLIEAYLVQAALARKPAGAQNFGSPVRSFGRRNALAAGLPPS